MQSSLSWIEWLDRLDRVLNGAREDVRALASFDDPQALAVVERCKRQLTALTDDLRLLDRRVLSTRPGTNTDRAGNLQKALDTTVFHLGTAVQPPVADSRSARERLLGTIDSALRDSCYEAAMLLGPVRLRA
jgi:class 3 adenylate cyclase